MLIQEQNLSVGVEHFDYEFEIIAQDSALNFSNMKRTTEKCIVRIRGSNSHDPVFEKVIYFN